MKNKAQNEIMGFAMIVIIVLVLILVLLSLGISKGNVIDSTSPELSNFLEASMQYTTNCTTTTIPVYKTFEGIIKTDYEGRLFTCTDSKSIDLVLNDTVKEIISALKISNDSYRKAYNLTMEFQNINDDGTIELGTFNKQFSEGEFANCTYVKTADHAIPSNGGNIIVVLTVCESE
jgi:hypothetical protein